MSISLINRNCKVEKVTSKVNICSVSVPRYQPGEIIKNHSICCALMLCRFGQLRNSSVFNEIIFWASVLQAVLPANTEPFRDGRVEMRNRVTKMRNGLRRLIVPVQIPSKVKLSKLAFTFQHEVLNFFPIKFWYYLMHFFPIKEIPLIF